MSSSWSRFKQSTREVIRKAEKSETPQDITELSQNADRLQKVYSDVIDKSEYWIVPVKQRGSPSGRPLTALGSAWNLLADNYNEPDTVAFLRAAADTVIQLGEQKAELDIKNWTEYMEPKKEIVKSNIKEGHSALEKLKTRRLDLDSKKHKLTHSDADKVIHYQQSVTLAQERYDQTANQIRELLGPIADDGHVGAIQADQVGLVLNNLLEYSRRQTEMLEELNRKINFVERAENAHKRPALEISIASRFPSNSSSSELPDDNQSEHTSPTLRPSASQSSLPSLRPSGSHSSIPSLRPSASQNSIGSSQGSSLAANAPPSANAPVGQHPGMMNGAVPLPHLLGQPTPIGAAGRRGQPPPVTQRKPSLNTVLQQPVFKAMALYDFPAQEATDLSFQKDDVIVLKTWEGDWWEGTINGQSGTFPRQQSQNTRENVQEFPTAYPPVHTPEAVREHLDIHTTFEAISSLDEKRSNRNQSKKS